MSATPILKRLVLTAAAGACVVLGLAAAGGAAGPTPTLVVWGDNTSHQLSYTAPGRSVIPTPVQGGDVKCTTANLGQASAVAGGGNHSLALIKPPGGGFVCGWGHSFYGQLGQGVFSGRRLVNVPAPVCRPTSPVSGACINPANQFLQGAIAIGGGGFHSMALLDATNNMGLPAGTVVTWGQNNNGELGTGTVADSAAPVAVCLGPAPCGAGGPFLSGVTAISAGLYFNLALLGPNNSMGLPPGSVVSWGDNTYGELGIGNNTASPNTCTPGPSSSTFCSQYPQQVMGIDKGCGGGPNSTGSIGPGPLVGVTAISAGQSQSLALLRSGNVCSWGDNAFGQLGIKNDGTITTARRLREQLPLHRPVVRLVRAHGAGSDLRAGLPVRRQSLPERRDRDQRRVLPQPGAREQQPRRRDGLLVGPELGRRARHRRGRAPTAAPARTAVQRRADRGLGRRRPRPARRSDGDLRGRRRRSAQPRGRQPAVRRGRPGGRVGRQPERRARHRHDDAVEHPGPRLRRPGPITVGPVACSGYLTGVTRGLDAAVNTFAPGPPELGRQAWAGLRPRPRAAPSSRRPAA